MKEWIISMMQQYGYFGIFSLILIENIFPPIPSEVILAFGGFMTTQSNLSLPIVIVVATLGSVAGAIVLYWLGTILNFERIERLTGKYGRFLGLNITDVEKAVAYYEKYQNKTVFFCRMIPVVRSLISIPAGMAKMPLPSFIFFTTAGSLIWNSLLVIAGRMLGQAWETILSYLDAYAALTSIVIALVLVALMILFFKKRIFKKK